MKTQLSYGIGRSARRMMTNQTVQINLLCNKISENNSLTQNILIADLVIGFGFAKNMENVFPSHCRT